MKLRQNFGESSWKLQLFSKNFGKSWKKIQKIKKKLIIIIGRYQIPKNIFLKSCNNRSSYWDNFDVPNPKLNKVPFPCPQLYITALRHFRSLRKQCSACNRFNLNKKFWKNRGGKIQYYDNFRNIQKYFREIFKDS